MEINDRILKCFLSILAQTCSHQVTLLPSSGVNKAQTCQTRFNLSERKLTLVPSDPLLCPSHWKNFCLFLCSLGFCGARLEKNKINKNPLIIHAPPTSRVEALKKPTKQKMKGLTSPSCIIYRATRWEKTGMFWLKIPQVLQPEGEFGFCGPWALGQNQRHHYNAGTRTSTDL